MSSMDSSEKKAYDDAIKRLEELWKTVNKNSDLFTSKKITLETYSKSFDPNTNDGLNVDDFIEFLHFRNNHHWTLMDMQTKNLTLDKESLKNALVTLLDETKSIQDRIDRLPKVKGLGEGIFSPFLLVASNQKYGVLNLKSRKFLSKYHIMPNERSKKPGLIFKEVNDLLLRLSNDTGMDLWTLDGLFHYDMFLPKVKDEKNRREKIWSGIKLDSNNEVPTSELVTLELSGGNRGIYAPVLRGLGERIALSIKVTETRYDDVIEDDVMTYKFPGTNQPQQDENDIEGMINAMHYQVPIFVIKGNKSKGPFRELKIGLVREFDNESKWFLIDLFDHIPGGENLHYNSEDSDEGNFKLYEKKSEEKEVKTKARPNQIRFRFNVIKRYGAKCSVCGLNLEPTLEAAHIIPKSKKGSDQSPNGLVMCANHHKMFDSHMFSIDNSLNIVYRNGYSKDKLLITVDNLEHLAKKPNVDAIDVRLELFKRSK